MPKVTDGKRHKLRWSMICLPSHTDMETANRRQGTSTRMTAPLHSSSTAMGRKPRWKKHQKQTTQYQWMANCWCRDVQEYFHLASRFYFSDTTQSSVEIFTFMLFESSFILRTRRPVLGTQGKEEWGWHMGTSTWITMSLTISNTVWAFLLCVITMTS